MHRIEAAMAYLIPPSIRLKLVWELWKANSGWPRMGFEPTSSESQSDALTASAPRRYLWPAGYAR